MARAATVQFIHAVQQEYIPRDRIASYDCERVIASAKDDEPVSIRPFDAITFILGDLWP